MPISKEEFNDLRELKQATRRRKGYSIWSSRYFRPHIWRRTEDLEVIEPGAEFIRNQKRVKVEESVIFEGGLGFL